MKQLTEFYHLYREVRIFQVNWEICIIQGVPKKTGICGKLSLRAIGLN